MVLLSVVAINGFAATPEHEPLQPLVDIPTDIKSQPLADALTAWAQLTGYQIVVPQSKAAERITPEIKGNMTAQESLDRLLAGTGLIFERINDRTVAIHEDSFGPAPITPEPEKKPMLASLEKVEVTGTRIPVTAEDIKANGAPLTPAPVTVFSRKKLDQLGVSQTADFLDYLSQQPFRTREFQLAQQFPQTRGLGFDSTLILIDGRRTLPSAAAVGWNAFDLNMVPQAAVERIEVLSDSASAVYGSDAVGGVVNIITKKNIRDTTLDFDYGAAAGGGDEQRAALLSGYSNDKLKASVALEYYSRNPLYGSERERLNNQDFRRFGGEDMRSLNSNPGNVRSLDSSNLPGLSTSFAAIPTGSSGVGLTPEDFLSTAGKQNKTSAYKDYSILPMVNRKGASVSAELDLTPQVKVFVDGMYTDNASTRQSSSRAISAIVPASNPFNPFGVDVAVDYLLDGIGPERVKERSEMVRGLSGVRGAWDTWDWELSVLRSEDRASAQRTNDVVPDRVTAALNATDPTQALNVFQDGAGGSAALLASLVADPRPGHYLSTGTIASGILRGALFALPAGFAQVVAGGEWRTESVLYDQPNLDGDPGSVVVKGNRKISAIFGEIRVPLVSPTMEVAAISDLSVTIAARRDEYSDFGSTLNPQYGLLWKPTPDFAFRASYGTSFRAPSQFELFLPRIMQPNFLLSDPLRNGEAANLTLIGGGNTNLDPTKARSGSAGIVVTPRAVPELQISVSRWQIEMSKLITIPSYYVLAAAQPGSTGRAVRAEPTAEDIAAGLPGVLISLDVSRLNVGTLKTSGVDFTADYSFETSFGRFVPSLSASWTDEYETVGVLSEQTEGRVGRASLDGTIPKWHMVATLGWSLHGLSLSTTARHTPRYKDTNGFEQAVDRYVQSQTLIDAQVSFDFDAMLSKQSSWSGLKITAGVSNLFNDAPSYSEVAFTAGFDPSQGDLRQRFGYLKLSKRF